MKSSLPKREIFNLGFHVVKSLGTEATLNDEEALLERSPKNGTVGGGE